MYNFRIDKNIPVPSIVDEPKRKKQDWSKITNMKVGDSFLYDGTMSGAFTLMFYQKRKLGYDFVTAKTRYGNRRIWRVI